MEKIQKVKKAVHSRFLDACVGIQLAGEELKKKLLDKSGQGVTEHAGMIVGGIAMVIIGVLALSGIFKDKVIPGVGKQIDQLFNVK